ncbi:hypothetical protein KBX49_09130 [Liquorilactobacillus satsumensis]|uniref:hypothetical protein n=1 Tax=Liquorilactobacillus satsumensis TaxID=259059 RepID=UPI0021C29280|nr:hypothetical protein [Liquorilactobacillus satsumensis]MCP9357365.1 hypothetical protein [Liquorilactobacillus satsumensis]MCP9372075.1 hypothetical protein [Liquorilactobacillus satsumensis]
MAKTLIYAAGSPESVKIGDTDTVLYLQMAKDGLKVDLTKVNSIAVKVANNESFLKTITIDKNKLSYDPTHGVVEVPLSKDSVGALPTGTYGFEVWITTADNESEIYPDVGVIKFTIFNNIESGAVVYANLTLQDFQDAFNALYLQSKSATDTANDTNAKSTTAYQQVQQVLNTLNSGNYAKLSDVAAVQSSVDTSAVGTNLLTGTSNELQSFTDWIVTKTLSLSSLGLSPGETVTYRVFLVMIGANGGVSLNTIDASGNKIDSNDTNGRDVYDTQSAYSTVTYTIPSNAVSLVLDFWGSNKCQWKEEKLERGKVAHDWSANPADNVSQTQLMNVENQLNDSLPQTSKGYSSDGLTFLNGTSFMSGGYKTIEFPSFKLHHIKISLKTSLSSGSVNLVQFPINLGGTINLTTLDGTHLIQITSDNKLEFLRNLNGSSYPTSIDIEFIAFEDK